MCFNQTIDADFHFLQAFGVVVAANHVGHLDDGQRGGCARLCSLTRFPTWRAVFKIRLVLPSTSFGRILPALSCISRAPLGIPPSNTTCIPRLSSANFAESSAGLRAAFALTRIVSRS